jgi:hypothetical protein
VALSVQEFMFVRDMNDASLDVVCRNFVNDSNRAVVWFIRYRAFTSWRARAEMGAWLDNAGRTPNDACEVAASFELNDRWEFDVDGFCSAVDSVVRQRS